VARFCVGGSLHRAVSFAVSVVQAAQPNMFQWRSLHHRLLLVVALGLVASVLSLAALVRVFLVSTVLRTDRARDAVAEELDSLTKRSPDESVSTALVGMRVGKTNGPADPVPQVPASWQATLLAARQRAADQHARVMVDAALEGGVVLVAGVQPSAAGGQMFVAYAVAPPSYATSWKLIVISLGLTTILLVAATLHAVRTVRRGANLLQQSIHDVGADLGADVPRPEVQELSMVADGIEQLARHLKASREAESELQKELAQRERLAALGRVVTGVAHEVRNPLASIKLRLDLAAALGDMPSGGQKALAHASSEIERLDRLVADLLVVAGRATGPKADEDVGALVEERLDALAPWAASFGVTLRAAGRASAVIHRDSVTRAIDNLVRNAVEAAPEGSEVSVFVQSKDTDVAIVVDDAGLGVEGGRTGELFEPFFTTKASGTGLGLALSRSIARAHGGEVSYERADGHTRFALSLPRAAAPSVIA
jgi:signal transduction histidine kinase